MHVSVEPVWNWYWLILAVVAMVSVVLLTYPQRVRSLPVFWRNVLLGLRLFAVCLLLFAMLRPVLQISETDRQRSELAVLFDASRSMQTADSQGGRTRREALVQLWQSLQQQRDDLGKEVDLKLMDFSGSLAPITGPGNLAEGNSTAIGKVLNDLREQSRNDRLIGVVMLTDGAQRAGGEEDLDPLLAARRLAEEKGTPIHPVPFGTSELSASGLDLVMEEMILDQPVTFEKKQVPVRMRVRLQGAAGRTVRVQLLMEDRAGKALGESGVLKPIPLSQESKPFADVRTSENSASLNVDLSFIADQPGEYKIAAEVVPVDGEIKLNNNRLESLLTVRKGGLRVVYFDTLRVEQKFIKELNDTAKIQLDMQYIVGDGGRNTRTIDPRLFEPRAYDVYLIGDVPASAFQSQGRNFLTALADRVREGAGLGMLGGVRNYGAGGYANSPLADLLPVKMTPEQRGAGGPLATGVGHPVRMLPTRDGLRMYLMQLASSQNDQVWRSLPEMSGATRLIPKSGAVEILAESEQQDPLLIAADTGKGRVLASATYETWKWHLHGHIAEHQRFWQQVMLWLARKEFDFDQPVWARVEPRAFPPQARVPIEMGAQDEKGTLLPDAQFTVEVIRPDRKVDQLIPQRTGTGGLAEYTQAAEPGDYWVRVSAAHNGQSLGLSAMTRFVVESRDLEMDHPASDPGLMSELAAMTGGTVVPPESLGEFLTSVLKEGIPSEFKRTRRIPLWDGWPLLLLFVGTMSLEWTIRKWKGLV